MLRRTSFAAALGGAQVSRTTVLPPTETLRTLHAEAAQELARLQAGHQHAALLAGIALLGGVRVAGDGGETSAALSELRRTERLVEDARRRVRTLSDARARLEDLEPPRRDAPAS